MWPLENFALIVGLNPSTADAQKDDNTIRRERALVREWGFAEEGASGAFFNEDKTRRFLLFRPGLVKVNLFDIISTKPRELLDKWIANVSLGAAHTDELIETFAKKASIVVAAWGGPYTPRALQRIVDTRAHELTAKLDRIGIELQCLGHTKDGYPRHPLFMPRVTPPRPWRGPHARA